MRRAAEYGVRVEGAVTVDMKAVKARKDAVVAPSRNGVERSLKTLEGCTVYEGHGRFVTEKKVAVNGSELVADHIFINVGGRVGDSADPGSRPGSLSHQQLDDGHRFPSRASRHFGRQLHRS